MEDSEYKKYYKEFELFVRLHVKSWKNFHEHWLRQDLPLFISRYEDLNFNPE
jgi:hypothetical protein